MASGYPDYSGQVLLDTNTVIHYTEQSITPTAGTGSDEIVMLSGRNFVEALLIKYVSGKTCLTMYATVQASGFVSEHYYLYRNYRPDDSGFFNQRFTVKENNIKTSRQLVSLDFPFYFDGDLVFKLSWSGNVDANNAVCRVYYKELY